MEYKVGDKVRIRKNLKVDKSYGGATFVDKMEKHSGRTMTVDSITFNNKYLLKEDGDKWYWTDEMFEGAECITILVKDNKVIAKKGDKVGIAKCSPEDEFDIFTGVRLAIDRLEEKCKPYSWLKYGVRYFVPDFVEGKLYTSFTYRDVPVDKRIKEHGIAFKTKEEAVAAAEKMLAVLKES